MTVARHMRLSLIFLLALSWANGPGAAPPAWAAAALPQGEVFAQQRRNEWIYLATGWSITLALFGATFLATSREYKLKAAAKSLTEKSRLVELSEVMG